MPAICDLAIMLSLPLATFDKLNSRLRAAAESVDLVFCLEQPMKSSDADILIVPGWSGSGPDHWQSRWEAKLTTARRVEQADWYKPVRDEWAERASSRRCAPRHAPSCWSGIPAASARSPMRPSICKPGEVAGAFLVAPPSETAKRAIPGMAADFAEHRREALPFPALRRRQCDGSLLLAGRSEGARPSWGAEYRRCRRRRPSQHQVRARPLAGRAVAFRRLPQELG